MKTDINTRNRVGRSQKIWAFIMLLTGISAAWTEKAPASFITSCGFLLYAWSLAYYPAPRFHSTINGIYSSKRAGENLPRHVRLVMFLAFLLMSIGLLYPYMHGSIAF